MNIAQLIPHPKAVYPESGSFSPPPGAAVHCPAAAERVGRRLGALLGLPVHLHAGSAWSITVGTAPTADGPAVPDKPDAYAMAVEPEQIRLGARSYRGLVYAATTLEAIGTGCGRLVDFADLPVRGVHLDLKGPALQFPYLCSLVERLGRAKINALLIEYEDKFPFQAYPEVVGEGALTLGQLKELLELASAWGIEVIPLVQCLGHAEYLLKHHAYRHLAEDENLQQLCPSNSDTFAFFAGMAAEVRRAHPGIRYFHIGGDESGSLGNCPQCSAVAEARGKKGLYADYVTKAAEYIVGCGLKPIIWDDMFHGEKAHPLLDQLPAETAVMVWDYHVYEPEVSHIRWGHQRYASHRYAGEPEQQWGGGTAWLEELPPEEQELIAAVKFGGGEIGLGDPVPWVRAIQARGLEVFGASASKGADGDNSLWPLYDRRFDNVALWARRAHEASIAGVVSTTWSRYCSFKPPVDVWESSWYTTLASAELYWNTGTSRARWDRKFGPLAPALDWMARGRRLGERKYLHAARERFQAAGEAVLEVCAVYELLLQETAMVERNNAWHLYYLDDPDPTRLRSRADTAAQLADLHRRWREWEAKAEAALRHELQPAGLAELIGTKSSGPLEKIAWLMRRLSGEQ